MNKMEIKKFLLDEIDSLKLIDDYLIKAMESNTNEADRFLFVEVCLTNEIEGMKKYIASLDNQD